MGKAAKIKQMRRIAKRLQPIMLPEKKGGKKGFRTINHVREMKGIYNKHGAQGVSDYLSEVVRLTQQSTPPPKQ